LIGSLSAKSERVTSVAKRIKLTKIKQNFCWGFGVLVVGVCFSALFQYHLNYLDGNGAIENVWQTWLVTASGRYILLAVVFAVP
jgi:cation transport ATPase